MANSSQASARTVLLVVAVAFGAVLLVTGANEFSAERIAQNERLRVLRSLQTVLDEDVATAQAIELEVVDEALLGTSEPVSVFAMLEAGEPQGIVFSSVAPDGYNAPIYLLVGLRLDGSVSGVRVIDHRETPGLGDVIEIEKSDWVLQFDDARVDSPTETEWRVDKDGGVFDSLTGATVTPRAVVSAVHATLIYFARERETLLQRAIDMATLDSSDE